MIQTYFVRLHNSHHSYVLCIRAKSEKQAKYLAIERLSQGSDNKHFVNTSMSVSDIYSNYEAEVIKIDKPFRSKFFIGGLSFQDTNGSGCCNVLYLEGDEAGYSQEHIFEKYGIF